MTLEVSERLVGSPAFKAGGMGDPHPAGSIPVHLRRKVERFSIARNAPSRIIRFVRKFFLFVLVAALIAWVAKKVREV